MCGIFAAVDIDNGLSHENLRLFRKSVDVIEHRGPDASGEYCYNTRMSNVQKEEFNLYLGHRRLSIIDLSANGNQPLEIGDYVIIFNGEIFNYQSLLDELVKDGVSFRTKTDTEVIIGIYKKYGIKGFDKLNGMWAFILLDKNQNKLIVSRDRFGIKPLYISRVGSSIYFASEIKQLLQYQKSLKADHSALYCYLKQSIRDYSENTFFENIKQFPKSNSLELDLQSGHEHFESYWDYKPIENLSETDYIDQFKALMDDSVLLRMVSDVEVGALLSGGLDSTVVSLLANKSAPSLRTFSVISKEQKYSEEEFIDIAAQEGNLKNYKFTLDPQNFLEHLDKTIYHQDEPFTTASVVASHLIFKHIKENFGLKVILSGQGADELLLGYLKFYFFYLSRLKQERKFLPLFANIFSAVLQGTIFNQFDLSVAKRYIPFLNKRRVDYLRLSGIDEDISSRGNMTQRQILDVSNYSLPSLFAYEDRNSMAYSIESRAPFMDHRLVNLLLHTPDHLKISKGWTKYMMRKHLTYVPDQIRWRKDKKGFETPEELWLKQDFQGYLKGLKQESALADIGAIDASRFTDSYNQYLNNSSIISKKEIFSVFIAERWARLNF
ncbi:asparagine synthase (glutamine-hydrolyzing) [Roseivirga sp. 4D4]|uniref:asparagine synthase (glutamine-hydrolyzing) n=1 Tax=Roseivirga sp. 4D4 TaxID=1889784 RepID=UPI000853072B|nr:asparagine synthase (glutamine-hydrolyzing) [Roseivirga sp. 4D4]OEK02493.1 asparagine synthase (glutamine-hydrolyzing) [Roseivirga sp. 4D4]